MIYNNSDISRLPDLDLTIRVLESITRRFPIVHRSPVSPIIRNPEVNILTCSGDHYTLKPNISCQGAIFGWCNDFDSLMKRKQQYSETENIVDTSKNDAYKYQFERLLLSHPFYRLLKEGIKLPSTSCPVSIDYPEGLALSYGLETSLIPLTSSLDIAAFHASTVYDRETNIFKPIDRNKTGVIFVFELNERFSLIKNLKVVGKQAFLRPGLNKLFALDCGGIDGLMELPNVKGFRFRQTEEGSTQIYNKFKQGKSLYPYEILSKKVNRLFRNERIFFTTEELEKEWFSKAAVRWNEFWKNTLFTQFSKEQIKYLLDIPYNHKYIKYFNQDEWKIYQTQND